MDVALSNEDIERLLNGRCNIVLYPNIHKFETLEQLLYPYDSCVLLFQSKPNYGHWVCITKHENDIEFFNSYGGYPDDSLNYINKKYAEESGQDYPYLTKLFLDSGLNLFYNEYKFQEKNKDIKTCGRHCVVRIIHKMYDIYQYKEILDELCEIYGSNYDGIVTMLTYHYDK